MTKLSNERSLDTYVNNYFTSLKLSDELESICSNNKYTIYMTEHIPIKYEKYIKLKRHNIINYGTSYCRSYLAYGACLLFRGDLTNYLECLKNVISEIKYLPPINNFPGGEKYLELEKQWYNYINL